MTPKRLPDWEEPQIVQHLPPELVRTHRSPAAGNFDKDPEPIKEKIQFKILHSM